MSSSIVLCSLPVLLALLSRAENCFCPRGGREGQTQPVPAALAIFLCWTSEQTKGFSANLNNAAEVIIFTRFASHKRQNNRPLGSPRSGPGDASRAPVVASSRVNAEVFPNVAAPLSRRIRSRPLCQTAIPYL